MSDDQFTKLYKYMQSEFAEIKDELSKKASQDSLDRLINTIDAFVKRLNDADIEQAHVMPSLVDY